MKPAGLLLDEHLNPAISKLLAARTKGIFVAAIRDWNSGQIVGCSDQRILEAAMRSRLVLVTFDVNTIPPLLQEMAQLGENHAGIIFLSRKSFRQNDLRGITTALTKLWQRESGATWNNRVVFLSRT